MKFNRILCAIFFLVAVYLTLFVSASTINDRQRSLSDDIRNGISIAGKLLGVDSPANIAVVSNIAELVTRAFSKPAENTASQNGWDRRQMTNTAEHLEDFDERPHTYQPHQSGHQFSSNEQGNIDDNVIVGNNNANTVPTTTTTTTTGIDTGFLTQVLRVMGMDSGKIGAIALNGIIFIAQMIGRSFMSAVGNITNRMSMKPSEDIDATQRSRRFSDDANESETSIWDNTIGWIIEQSKTNTFLSGQLDTMLDKNLPNRIVRMVDDDDADADDSNENTDCIKQLLCKTSPFIKSMQKAISDQMTKTDTDSNDDESSSTVAPEDDNRMNAFFQFLPTLDEFKNNGITCEDKYKECTLF